MPRRRPRAGYADLVGAARSRRNRQYAVAAMLTSDILGIALAALLAYLLRQEFPGLGRAADLSTAIREASLVISVGWIGAIAVAGGYDARTLSSGPELFRSVMRASLGAAGVVGAAAYLGGIELSRVFFVALFVIGTPVLLLTRLVMRRVLNTLRSRGRLRSRTLIVGGLAHVESVAATVHRESWLGYEVVGALVPPGETATSTRAGIPVLGDESELIAVMKRLRPAVILFTAGAAGAAESFRRIAWTLEDHDVDIIVVPALSEISGDRVSMRPVAGLPLVHLEKPRSRDALRASKRTFDVITTAVILVLISPVLALVALAVKLGDGGPVLFRQVRAGRDGELFNILKFRSMVTDAEARKPPTGTATQDRGNAVMFKQAADPRVTTVGRFLRRWSVDELPQLWNVLRGDMSLVGPRPALPGEISAYNQDARRRLAVRPGITGLWQVSGRSDLSWSETVRLDLYYVDNWSFTQDLQILARTVRAVIAGDGAY